MFMNAFAHYVKGKTYSFRISREDREELIVAALTEQDMQAWIDCLAMLKEKAQKVDSFVILFDISCVRCKASYVVF